MNHYIKKCASKMWNLVIILRTIKKILINITFFTLQNVKFSNNIKNYKENIDKYYIF